GRRGLVGGVGLQERKQARQRLLAAAVGGNRLALLLLDGGVMGLGDADRLLQGQWRLCFSCGGSAEDGDAGRRDHAPCDARALWRPWGGARRRGRGAPGPPAPPCRSSPPPLPPAPPPGFCSIACTGSPSARVDGGDSATRSPGVRPSTICTILPSSRP